MYSVYADGEMIFNDQIPLETHALVSPHLIMEDCSAGSLEFTLPLTNWAYGKLEPMKTEIVVKRDNEEIWSGRILTEDTDFYNQKHIYCEGELAYLNDTTQPANEYHDITISEFLKKVIDIHNSKVLDNKKFKINMVTVADDMTMSLRYTQYEKTLEVINNLIEDLGGHLRCYKNVFGERVIDYLEEAIDNSDQTIEFAQNMLDFTKTKDASEIATVILPLGGQIGSAQQSSVGEQIDLTVKTEKVFTPKTIGHVMEIYREDNVDKIRTYYNGDPKQWLAEIAVSPKEQYFYTGEMLGTGENGNYLMYCFLDNTNIVHQDGYEAGGGTAIKYLSEKRLEVPDWATRLIICGYENTIPLRLNASGPIHDVLDTYVTVESVNNGSLYIQSPELIEQYGWIEKQMTWDDVTEPAKLKELAESYLKEQVNDITLEIEASDLWIMGVNCKALKLLERIQVKSAYHNLHPSSTNVEDTWFTISKLDTMLNDPEDMTVTLGSNPTKSLTESNNKFNNDIYNKVTNLPRQTLNNAKENAAAMISSAVGGFVTLVPNEDGTATEAIVISESEDYTESQNMWIWNKNGLGYSTEGYNPSGEGIKAAITSDGQIVADAITTGEMSASRIRGDVLKLGGMDNENGIIQIVDSQGRETGTWTNSGFVSSQPNDEWESINWNRVNIENGNIIFRSLNQLAGGIVGGQWVGDNPRLQFFGKTMILAANGLITGKMSGDSVNPDSFSDCLDASVRIVTEIRGDGQGGVEGWDYATLTFKNGFLVGIS